VLVPCRSQSGQKGKVIDPDRVRRRQRVVLAHLLDASSDADEAAQSIKDAAMAAGLPIYNLDYALLVGESADYRQY